MRGSGDLPLYILSISSVGSEFVGVKILREGILEGKSHIENILLFSYSLEIFKWKYGNYLSVHCFAIDI